MNKTTAILIIVIIILAIFAVLYFVKPRIITTTEMVENIDSLYFYIHETMPPDTVEIIKRIPVPDESLLKSIKVVDLDAMIEARGTEDEGKIIIKDVPVHPDDMSVIPFQSYYKSTKIFKAEFLDGQVDAWALCKVDSFRIHTNLNRSKYLEYFEKHFRRKSEMGFIITGGYGHDPAIGAGVYYNQYGIQYIRHGSDNLFLGMWRFSF